MSLKIATAPLALFLTACAASPTLAQSALDGDAVAEVDSVIIND